jgi:hypothetical protein
MLPSPMLTSCEAFWGEEQGNAILTSQVRSMHSLEASPRDHQVRAVALGFVEVAPLSLPRNLIRHELSCDTELSGAFGNAPIQRRSITL